MEQYIKKSAVVAEINRIIDDLEKNSGYIGIFGDGQMAICGKILSFIDTLETIEISTDDSNLDDLFEEDGIDPYSKDAKLFKECYYTALERYKEKKGIV